MTADATWQPVAVKPPQGKLLIATDGKARWMTQYLPDLPDMKWSGHVATHWFLVPEFEG